MQFDKRTLWKPSVQGAGTFACGLLTLGLFAGTTLSQDGGGSRQGGTQGGTPGGQGGAETAPAKPREQPGQGREAEARATDEARGKLVDELGRLHKQFNDGLRSALRDADAGKLGKPAADEAMVTMFGDGLIVAAYPVEAAEGEKGAKTPATPGSAEREGGAAGRDSGTGGEAGGNDRGAGAAGTPDNGQREGAAHAGEGQLIGMLIVGGTGPANRPAKPVEAGAERNTEGRTANAATTGKIGEGTYAVHFIAPNTIALVRPDGSIARMLPVRHDGADAARDENGGAAPETRSPGQGGSGEAAGAGQGATSTRPTTVNTDTGRPQGDGRPEWSRVYLALLMEIEQGAGPNNDR